MKVEEVVRLLKEVVEEKVAMENYKKKSPESNSSTLGDLLKEAKERFKDNIKEIHNLIDSINKNRKIMLRELKYFEAKRIYDGDCEFIKYP